MKRTFAIALFVAFVDFIGLGLIYPLFSSLFFNDHCLFFACDTSREVRGYWLGLFFALDPLAQFFSGPIWGTLSDSRGRKSPLIWGMSIALFGYLIAMGAMWVGSLTLLLLSRIIVGLGTGNRAIIQAVVSDISSEKVKAKNFGLYNMALGAGFTLGPFFGGYFATFGYTVPFLFATALTTLNLFFVHLLFRETLQHLTPQTLSWHMGLVHLKKALHFKGIRRLFCAIFLYALGWAYFFEFTPLFLFSRWHFTAEQVGYFFAFVGICYALSTGLLIRPFVRYFSSKTLLFFGLLCTGLTIWTLPFVSSDFWFWPCIALLTFFVGFIGPASNTLISDKTSRNIQGEAFGILGSVNAAGYILGPFLAGFIAGGHPIFPMFIGGSALVLAALIMSAKE